jgi:hypothetical protein
MLSNDKALLSNFTDLYLQMSTVSTSITESRDGRIMRPLIAFQRMNSTVPSRSPKKQFRIYNTIYLFYPLTPSLEKITKTSNT